MRDLPSAALRRLLLGATSLVLIGQAQTACAQAIERNLPPAPVAAQTPIAPPNAVPAEQDAAPIGPALKAIVVLNGQDPLAGAPQDGVDVSRTPRLADDQRALRTFLGRPLSRKLIAEIEAEIARHYRRAGFPFVNLTTPEQEVTSGALQIRAVEFRAGAKSAPGAKPGGAAYVASRVRTAPGDTIDAPGLAQDLDWLNRFPYRKTEAVFTPGTAFGTSDLQLSTTYQKPWAVYAGYADSGSPLTGMDRYFAGVQTAVPGLHDAVASYQFTGSANAVFDHGTPFTSASSPAYVSHAGRLVIPTLARQDIEASIDYVQSNEPTQSFRVRQTTFEATLAYRGALSDLWRVLPGEGLIGVEAKRSDTRTLFGPTAVDSAGVDVFQLMLGYADQATDRFGRTSGELTLHMSPGGLDDHDADAAYAAFSHGRFDKAGYSYIGGDLTRWTQLPTLFGVPGFAVVNGLIGQYAAGPLPQTEQIGLGGASLVRGYTLDDGAFDSGLVSRNELRTPTFSLLGRSGPFADQASPYVFLDAGFGKDQRTKVTHAPLSTGFGMDYRLGAHITATLDGAWALHDEGLTRGGDVRLESRISFSL